MPRSGVLSGVLEASAVVPFGVFVRLGRGRARTLDRGDRISIDGTSYVLLEDVGELYLEIAGELAKTRQPLRQLIGRRVEL